MQYRLWNNGLVSFNFLFIVRHLDGVIFRTHEDQYSVLLWAFVGSMTIDDKKEFRENPLILWHKVSETYLPEFLDLKPVAFDFLCLPVSNAVAERVFSLLSRVLTDKRCNLGFDAISEIISLTSEIV